MPPLNESIETTINNRSDLWSIAQSGYAFQNVYVLKTFANHMKNSMASAFSNENTGESGSWSTRGSYVSNTSVIFHSQEGTWDINIKVTPNFEISGPIYRAFVEKPINEQNEQIATTEISVHPEIEEPASKESPLTTLLSDIRDLMKKDEDGDEEDEDEYGALRPTVHAFRAALILIIEASLLLVDDYPFGCASTDSEGGIRIEWFKTTGEIRLVVPASKEKEPYIYYEFESGEKYGVDRQANPEKLARWINRLTNI